MKIYSQVGKARAIDLGLYRPVIKRSLEHSNEYGTVPLRSLKKRRDYSPFDLMASRPELFNTKKSGGDVLVLKYKSDFDRIIEKQRKFETGINRSVERSVEKHSVKDIKDLCIDRKQSASCHCAPEISH